MVSSVNFLGRELGSRLPPLLLGILCCDPGEPEVAHFDALVLRAQQILSLEVSVHAVASVKVGQSSGDVDGEGESEAPGEGKIAVDVLSHVAPRHVLGNDENAVASVRSSAGEDVGGRSSRGKAESQVLYDVGMTSLCEVKVVSDDQAGGTLAASMRARAPAENSPSSPRP